MIPLALRSLRCVVLMLASNDFLQYGDMTFQIHISCFNQSEVTIPMKAATECVLVVIILLSVSLFFNKPDDFILRDKYTGLMNNFQYTPAAQF